VFLNPNIGNSVLYNQAENVQQMLDNWQPSLNAKVIQVAGWGEETLAGLDYKSYISWLGLGNEKLSYTPRMVVDGDATVVVPYASLAMPGRQTTYCYSHNYMEWRPNRRC